MRERRRILSDVGRLRVCDGYILKPCSGHFPRAVFARRSTGGKQQLAEIRKYVQVENCVSPTIREPYQTNTKTHS
jgi:hypothetical protein